MLGVDFGDHQRHVAIHAVGLDVGEHVMTRFRQPGLPLHRGLVGQRREAQLGIEVVGRRRQRDVAGALRDRFGQMPVRRVGVPLPGIPFRRREGRQFEPGMLRQQAHEALADGTGGAQHGHRALARRDHEAAAARALRPWNSSWIARTAASRCASSTTSEMLSSLDPCAMATTLIFMRPRALKTRAATPGVPFIPSPTAATIATGCSAYTRPTSCRPSSAANARSRSRMIRAVCSAPTTKQMLCSLLDWLIISTETPSAATVSKTRAAMPGTPDIPAPSTVIRPRPPSDVVALTMLPSVASASEVIVVPANDASKVLRIRTGMRASIAGSTVRGWMTFAPKNDSSCASSYDTRSTGRAPGTLRGSALMMPFTSVYIRTSSAPSAAAKM